MASCHHTSRPAVIAVSASVRRITTTWEIESQPPASASSTVLLSPMRLPPRTLSLAVTTALAPASLIRSSKLLAEKPPNTTE